VFGVELVVAQPHQELLDTLERGAGFIRKSFERNQENALLRATAKQILTTSL